MASDYHYVWPKKPKVDAVRATKVEAAQAIKEQPKPARLSEATFYNYCTVCILVGTAILSWIVIPWLFSAKEELEYRANYETCEQVIYVFRQN